ncbi:hypothetical protein M427DRAFT_58901 [Gonapodya prolifera JEL478]|uniref:Inhibitor I9 domain-containing protein n=1 Tax=Gonapodya prolifera (strain JEL478) TaxID=1344416 RepID=A0A139A8Q6_GONPJ|nr:hypothetical protein M427DRAFT_58901 [Gonapodya prolifera JEL478]|eukprot:KXS13186.1 hypothetical protein M427DRAFT_58901 [Gonapodya prolifera JEL478]
MTGKYIVAFKKGTPKTEIDKVKDDIKKQGATIGHEYTTTFQGFAVTLPTTLVSTLESHPHIDYVEADQEMSIAK